jgi:hypothetical protein
MQRYYFHVTDGERTFADEVGRTFATPAAAEGHAATIATELASDEGWEGFSVVVKNQDGHEVARVSIHLH